jgi:hypothetical protein
VLRWLSTILDHACGSIQKIWSCLWLFLKNNCACVDRIQGAFCLRKHTKHGCIWKTCLILALWSSPNSESQGHRHDSHIMKPCLCSKILRKNGTEKSRVLRMLQTNKS